MEFLAIGSGSVIDRVVNFLSFLDSLMELIVSLDGEIGSRKRSEVERVLVSLFSIVRQFHVKVNER
jgi:hypothetical protein